MKANGTLVDIMKSLNDCRSADDITYFMNECYLDKTHDEIVLVATDGRMMVTYRPDAPTMDMLKLKDIPEGYVTLDAKRLVVQPLPKEGQFPNWRRVVPDIDTYMAPEIGFPIPENKMVRADILARFARDAGILIKYEYMAKIALHLDGLVFVSKDAETRKEKAIVYTHTSIAGKYTAIIMPYDPDWKAR